MAEVFSGLVEIQDAAENTTISLRGNTAGVVVGGDGSSGQLTLFDGSGDPSVTSTATASINATNANLKLGSNGVGGSLFLFRSDGDRDDNDTASIHLDGQAADARLGANGADGDLVLFRADGDNVTAAQATIHLDGGGAEMRAGGNGSDGDIRLQSPEGEDRIRLDAGGGNGWFGGHGADGDLVLFRADGDNVTSAEATIHLDGAGAELRAGGNGSDGDIRLQGSNGEERIRLDAGGGNIWLGGNGADGDLVLFADNGDNSTLAQATIHLNGQTGDIILQNGDCAEDFEVEDDSTLEAGSVVVLNKRARLAESTQPYDRRVAGIVAGAGTLKPGIILGRKADDEKRLPVALMGRVFCKVDARFGDIEVGDLLTTSPTPGHAMRASDASRAVGSIIGKALARLSGSSGLIPVLVALQ